MMTSTTRPRVFLDVNIGETPAGRLTIELFTDKTPRTCENFRSLCTGEYRGMSYAKAPFHRVIDEFMIQGGDIANGDGTGTASIYNGEFEDENLDWREMDAAGLVCSANRGRDTNGSQFFITLEPTPHLNGKHTIFGRLVTGQDTLAKIAKVDVDDNDTPLEPVLVSRCGELERKGQPTARRRTSPPVESADRGRRKKSDASDAEMEDSPAPQERQRVRRRQSDNAVDEGLRGRPRQRSGDRSPAQPLSTAAEESDIADSRQHSPAAKHKRKRSTSPSRHIDGPRQQDDDDEYERRRRRSLPNQYRDGERASRYEDENRYRPSPRRDDRAYAGRRHGDERYSGDNRNRGNRGRHRYEEHGRLGSNDESGGGYDDHEPAVKFKGRGVMKYREPGRL